MPKPANPDGERLQKLLAKGGIASRRAAEELIAQGRVSVNGHVVKELGTRADPVRDRIVVDSVPLSLPSGPPIVLLMNKPKGVVTTTKDPEGRRTVVDLLPPKYKHLHPVGRLDFDTSGAIILTDDGDLTQFLTHPSHGVEKTYWARVPGPVSIETLKKLESGIFLEDGKTAPCRARLRAATEKNALVELALREGRNRQVRRMLLSVGHPVKALRRVRFGGLDLEGLLSGEFRVLLPGEVHALRKAADAKPTKPKRPERKPKPASETDSAKLATPKSAAKPAAKTTKTIKAATRMLTKGEAQSAKQHGHQGAQNPLTRRIEKQWGQKTRKRA